MKKIMFNDKYSLTAAVLEGRKTMTRRVITGCKSDTLPYGGIDGTKYFVVSTNDGVFKSTYKVGEIVAVAQSYSEVYNKLFGDVAHINNDRALELHMSYILMEAQKDAIKGWTNKMFIRPSLMPHHIRITDIKIERLQDISNEDCVKEGILHWKGSTYENLSTEHFHFHGCNDTFSSAKEAFAALIDKVSGKGTWDSNPWVFAYSFVLID
jgi:hypothetical protein